jgi:hypothetical protein
VVTGGAEMPSAKMAGQPANSPGWLVMDYGQSIPRDEGRSPPARQGFPCTTIGKEH